MLFTSLALVLAGTCTDLAPAQLPFFRPRTFDSARFADDKGQGEYFYRFRIHIEEEPDDEEVYRVVRTRPEAPAAGFSMSDIRVKSVTSRANRPSVDEMKAVSQAAGVASSGGKSFFQTLNKAFLESRETISNRAIEIDPNQGVKPGGWTVRTYGWDVWYTDTHVQLMQVGADGSAVTVGEESIFELYEHWIVVPLLHEKFIPDPIHGMEPFHFQEGFGGIKFNDQQADMLGLGGAYLPRLRTGVSVFGNKSLTTNATQYRNDVLNTLPKRLNDFSTIVGLAPKKIDDMLSAVAGQGSSMNALNVPGDLGRLDAPSCGSELTFPAGTLWVPDRPGYQSMMSSTRFGVNFPAFASTTLPATIVGTGRTHCLNMALKEPEEGVRYFPYMSNDPVLDGLAELTEASRMRGPWDQVRTWIYTDKVSMRDANKRISPEISESRYINGLYDVFHLGGLTEKELNESAIFDPDLLLSPYASDDALYWFVMTLEDRHVKALRTWIENPPKELTNMLAMPEDESQKETGPALIERLLTSTATDVRIAALSYLDRSPGVASALKGKIGDFSLSLYSEDKKEADLALRVASKLR